MRFFNRVIKNKDDDEAALRQKYNYLCEKWFSKIGIGDTVYNLGKKQTGDTTVSGWLREGVVKEVVNRGLHDSYVIVDNLTTGRQNKWHDFDLVKSDQINEMADQLHNISIERSKEISRSQIVNGKPVDSTGIDRTQELFEDLLVKSQSLLNENSYIIGDCAGVYGAFSKRTGECIYIGKSNTSIRRRWTEHKRLWKKDKPIHRQPLLTQYLHFFGDKIEWRVIVAMSDKVSNDLIEYVERRIFEKYMPIANTIIPNGTIFGRSVMEGEGDVVTVSTWNPSMVSIRVKGGQFVGFSDGLDHL